MNNFMQQFNQFAQNPAQYFARFGVKGSNPDEIIQQMLNSGRISQAQYNAARQAAQQMMAGSARRA